MPKLCQVIAIEKGVKAQAHGVKSELYKIIQKPELFHGFTKVYQPREDGDDLPSERKNMQYTTKGVLRDLRAALRDMFTVVARHEWTNGHAEADIVVDGQVLAAKVPVAYLLFLEKELTDMRTFIDKLPVLDSADDWRDDPVTGAYKTEPAQTHRTKKVQKALVLYPATAEHPAQTQLVSEDVVAGYWSTVKQSGALPSPDQAALAQRVEALLRAVKEAREAANTMEEMPAPDIAQTVLGYIFRE